MVNCEFWLDVRCFSPMRRNWVLDELRIKRLTVIQEEMFKNISVGELCLNQNYMDAERRKVVCHRHQW